MPQMRQRNDGEETIDLLISTISSECGLVSIEELGKASAETLSNGVSCSAARVRLGFLHTVDQISFEALASADSESFEQLFSIYIDSLPSNERKRRPEISAMCVQEGYRVLIANRNDVTIGFSIIFAPIEEPFCLLEYMAVHPAHRHLGVGRELFRYTVKVANATMLLEVDSPREPSDDRKVRQRRQSFYRNLGCLRLDALEYLLPLRCAGPPPAMDLMVHGSSPDEPIQKAQVEHWLRVIYRSVYGCSPSDSRIDRMLEPLTDPVRLI